MGGGALWQLLEDLECGGGGGDRRFVLRHNESPGDKGERFLTGSSLKNVGVIHKTNCDLTVFNFLIEHCHSLIINF